jgi:F-type H+-transporting ATPase subunit a
LFHEQEGGSLEGIRDKLVEELNNRTAFTIPVFGGIPVGESVVITWGIMAFLVVLSIILTRNLKKVPGKRQLVAELYVGFMNNFAKKYMGEHWKSFAPYFGTIGLYLGVANMVGMFGITPPTKDLNVTAGLALMSCGLIYGSSFRYKGLKGGLHKFLEPNPMLLPINVMEIIIRPLSLCMRLFGNVLGAFIIMELLKLAVPAILPMAMSLYFDVFDGIIQAVVFVFLTAMFTQETME